MVDEPENLVLAQLKGLRSDVAGTNERLDALTEKVGTLADNVAGGLESAGHRLAAIEAMLEWFQAQVRMISMQASDAAGGRSRLEAQIDR